MFNVIHVLLLWLAMRETELSFRVNDMQSCTAAIGGDHPRMATLQLARMFDTAGM